MSAAAKARLTADARGRAAADPRRATGRRPKRALTTRSQPGTSRFAIRSLRFADYDAVHDFWPSLLASRQPRKSRRRPSRRSPASTTPGSPASCSSLAGNEPQAARDGRRGDLFADRPGSAPSSTRSKRAGWAAPMSTRPGSICSRPIPTRRLRREPPRFRRRLAPPPGRRRRLSEGPGAEGRPRAGQGGLQKNCSSCHRLENVGQQVGADLSAVRDRGLDAVLLNILDPNREVMPQYLSYVLVTTSGRVSPA